MFRRVVLSSSNVTSGSISLVYYVKSARLICQARLIAGDFDANISNPGTATPLIFTNAIRLSTASSIGKNIYYLFDLDVGENQPTEESVSEISSAGVAIAVYNANGVLVCDNGVTGVTSIDPVQSAEVSGVPGEMTSETIDGPGEMTSEPIDGTGEMTSEPIGGTGEMT